MSVNACAEVHNETGCHHFLVFLELTQKQRYLITLPSVKGADVQALV